MPDSVIPRHGNKEHRFREIEDQTVRGRAVPEDDVRPGRAGGAGETCRPVPVYAADGVLESRHALVGEEDGAVAGDDEVVGPDEALAVEAC